MIMKVEMFTIAYQMYLTPTIQITYNRVLNGSYEVCLMWLNKGIVIK